MTINRRDFMKANAAAAAAAAAGISLPAPPAAAQSAGMEKIRWDKAACRFCGTGCHVQVGVQAGRVVAIAGDEIYADPASIVGSRSIISATMPLT